MSITVTRFARGRRSLPRILLAVALCFGLLGLLAGVLAAHRFLAEETAQARAFVAEGQHALARGDRGAAVLALERARWLAPRSGAVRSALDAAGVKDAEPVLPRTLRLVTSREWSAIAIAAGWVFGLGVVFVLVRRQQRGARWVALAAGVAFVVAMAAIVESDVTSPAVITGADARLLVAPYGAADGDRVLPAGTTVIAGPLYDDFVHVETGDGAQGWVRGAGVERIASPES